MPRRDWLLYLAVGLTLALGALLASAVKDYGQPAPWATEDGGLPRSQADQRQYNYEQHAQDADAWIAAIKNQGIPKIPCADSGDGANCTQYREALDLGAQWSTAESAKIMLGWTQAQFFIGFFGLLALGISLWMTRESVNAALKSVDVTIDTARREQRAYLVVNIAGLDRQRRNAVFATRPEFTNMGQTPAYDVMVGTRLEIHPPILPPNFNFIVPIAGNPVSRMMLGPGQNRFSTAFCQTRLTKQQMRNIKLGIERLYVYGTVWYTDSFGTVRWTNFCNFAVIINKREVIWMAIDRHNNGN